MRDARAPNKKVAVHLNSSRRHSHATTRMPTRSAGAIARCRNNFVRWSSEEMVMKRLRTPLGAALPLALGFTFLLGGSENSHAGCQLQSPGGQIKHVVH